MRHKVHVGRCVCKRKVFFVGESGRPVFAVNCESLEMLSSITPPPSPTLQGAERESCIWVPRGVEVTREVGVENEAEVKHVAHEAEQVRGYRGFL